MSDHVTYTTMPEEEIRRIEAKTGKRVFATIVSVVNAHDVLNPSAERIGMTRNHHDRKMMINKLLEIRRQAALELSDE